MKNQLKNQLPVGKFESPDSLPEGRYRSESDDFNYLVTVLIAMIFTIPSFGFIKGIIVAIFWPLVLFAYIFL